MKIQLHSNATRRAALCAGLMALAALAITTHPARAAGVIEAWVQRYNGPVSGNDYAQAVVADGSGNVVVTGYSYGLDGTDDYYTAKYAAANGALLWERRYNGTGGGNDLARALALDGSGNVVVTGRSPGNGSTYDYYTAKYAAADGALLWEKRYHGTGNDYDAASAVAVDGSGNVMVTGYSTGTNGNFDFYTAKYAAADGELLWEQRYDGPEVVYNNDYARAVVVDHEGNVVVTGDSGNGTTANYYTAKYAAADGALLWQAIHNGQANDYDAAFAVAVDRSGNVIVTGASSDGLKSDYLTAKYAAADGELLWMHRYISPVNGADVAQAVAVDGSGNVVVTGVSHIGITSEYYTAKYAAADGALLWDKRYNSGLIYFFYDPRSAVAVDGDGNVVVNGSFWNGINADYFTAKYAAVNGTLLWEKHYNGPANGEDFVGTGRSLALGPCGSVAITGSSSGDYATILYREDDFPVYIALYPGGIHLRFTGVPNHRHVIERAPAVTGPWNAIATRTATAGCLVEYTDPEPPPGMAFYRIAPAP